MFGGLACRKTLLLYTHMICPHKGYHFTFAEKQNITSKLGIKVYPSEDHKVVRIASKLPVVGDKISTQIISIASPILIIPREYGETQAYLDVFISNQESN
jgi:hypothetical protein